MQIWTFWEPRDKIPYYLQLCMKTWTRYLPEANVTVLDFSNIQKFIDLGEFGANFLSGRFSLPQIADAIRVMLLEKYGGIWLDVDTIILDRAATKYFLPNEKFQLTVFGDVDTKNFRICFINARENSNCMGAWLEFVKERIRNLTPDTPVTWDYLGNAFANNYSKKHTAEINLIDENCVHPEYQIIPNADRSSQMRMWAYAEYYFRQQWHIEDVAENILLLHNSWTPDIVKSIDEKIFLRCNFTLANILMAALNLKRNLAEPQLTLE